MIALLDLDGTLIDSAKRHWMLMAELLGQYCPEEAAGFVPEDYMRYKADGHSGKQYLTQILHLDAEKAKTVQREWQSQIEKEEYLQTDILYKDAVPFLDRLKENGVTIVYLTARQEEQGLLRELDRLGIRACAAQVIVVDPAKAGEEKRRAGKALLQMDPHMVLVGDTENEYAAAQELQLPVCLLHRGFRSRRFWEERGVDTYGSLEEIDSPLFPDGMSSKQR